MGSPQSRQIPKPDFQIKSLYDFQSQHGWFEVKIVKIEQNTISLHYIGFPDHFDESLSVQAAESRLCKLHTHTENWRSRLAVGSAVDFYIKLVERWERMAIVEISSGTDRLKVGHLSWEWMDLDDERVAAPGTRTGGIRNTSENTDGCCFPGGRERALEVAAHYMNSSSSSEKRIGFSIYEELARAKLLPKQICLNLFTLYEQGLVHSGKSAEEIRFSHAKAAFMLEAAFLSPENEDDEDDNNEFGDMQSWERERARNGGAKFNVIASTPDVDDVVPVSIDTTAVTFFDAKVKGVNAFVQYGEYFRNILDGEAWDGLSKEHQMQLQIADLLEAKAWKSNSTVERRNLFSEAGLLIYQMSVARGQSLVLRQACHWRLARHYVNGLGIDVTELPLQDTADVQASEYMNLAKVNPYVKGLQGILLSVGRNYATFSLQPPIDTNDSNAIAALLKYAIERGVAPAMFWYAKLLLEGWGKQTNGSKRINLLKEAQGYFEFCAGLGFNSEEAGTSGERVKAIVALKQPYVKEPFYLLALYVYGAGLKRIVISGFPAVLLKLVKDFVKSDAAGPGKPLCGPVGALDSAGAEWLCHEDHGLRNRVLFGVGFLQSGSGSENKGGPVNGKDAYIGQVQRANAMWVKQKFNTAFFIEGNTTTRKWVTSDVDSLLNRVTETATLAKHVYNEPLLGTVDPVEEATARLSRAEIVSGEVQAVWQKALETASFVYNKTLPARRTLQEQCEFYDNFAEMLKSEEFTRSAIAACGLQPTEGSEAVGQVVLLARQFAVTARESEPDIVKKHALSALAVIRHARQNNVTVSESISLLDRDATALFKSSSLSSEYPTRIGYHIILDALRIRSFMSNQSLPAQRLMEGNIRYLTENGALNSNWLKGNDRPLLTIFQSFCDQVKETQRREESLRLVAGRPMPVLNLEALTFADPWAFLSYVDIDASLQHYFVDMDSIRAAYDPGTSTEVVMNDILQANILEKFRLLRISDAIASRLNGYATLGSNIQLKKKMLFLLDHVPTVNWESPDESALQVLSMQLTAGLGGRCPDGLNAFCDDFILQSTFQDKETLLRDIPQYHSRLVLSVSNLVYVTKLNFIKLHLSRHQADYEGRTVGTIALTNMLLLPLGLPGSYVEVKYPSYISRGHVDGSSLLSENVLRRYLDGGHIRYQYGEEVHFEKWTLARFAKILRQSIVKSGTGLSRSQGHQDQDSVMASGSATSNLESRPLIRSTINETIVEQFCENDVVLGRFYAQARSQDFVCDNKFFRAVRDPSDEPEDLNNDAGNSSDDVTRPHIVRVMNDAAIVRILEVLLYVKVPPEFWAQVSNNWTIS